ncbi:MULTISPECIES: anti-adapter protein IraP [Buttiauxella]|uniref:anti-adapter protein IraP n=1 Tax=Buttiauxella TaxID=82976 RepID=UPI00156151AA|nr:MULTISPECIES: anti-adapter protein IraP [Buttiauxella]MCS3604016.1 hypothetical protein [Buttiauxella sp. BIGb0471]BCG10588.1 anti-adapter protein IraP [Buttiauxella agrestis]
MKNLISELLSKLAEKEEESKEFVAQIEALEIVVTAMLCRMDKNDRQAMVAHIQSALNEVRPTEAVTERDTDLLKQYLDKLLTQPRN